MDKHGYASLNIFGYAILNMVHQFGLINNKNKKILILGSWIRWRIPILVWIFHCFQVPIYDFLFVLWGASLVPWYVLCSFRKEKKKKFLFDISHGRIVAMCGLTVTKVKYTMFLFFYLQPLKMGLMMKLKQKSIVAVLDFFFLNLSKN